MLAARGLGDQTDQAETGLLGSFVRLQAFGVLRFWYEMFTREHIFADSATNQQVYDQQCSDIVQSVMDGYNGTIFLYGQTKSGKTYTMLGSDDQPGLLHYALRDVFLKRAELKDKFGIKVYISYLEIYNEVLIDLLNPKGDPATLKIKEDQRVDQPVTQDGHHRERSPAAEGQEP